MRIEYYATVIQSHYPFIVRLDNPESLLRLLTRNTYLRAGYTGSRDELFANHILTYTDMELSVLQANSRLPAGSKENAVGETDSAAVAGIDNLQQERFFNSYAQSLGSDSINTECIPGRLNQMGRLGSPINKIISSAC
ncbi:MAG: hypothetical protein MZV64_03900 [Ignavibacteriales bacterium]|nr:hypothetical protein [Ignavibacteriales bacterium]